MVESWEKAEFMGISLYVGTWRCSGLCLQVWWRARVRIEAEKNIYLKVCTWDISVSQNP